LPFFSSTLCTARPQPPSDTNRRRYLAAVCGSIGIPSSYASVIFFTIASCACKTFTPVCVICTVNTALCLIAAIALLSNAYD